MTKNVAHRGFSSHYPENTMLAFEHAVAAGCEGIELDVQLSKDGQVVIIHDEMVDRTTDGTGLVRDYTLEELQKFNAAAKFASPCQPQHIPTLREYFEFMKDKPQFTNIELKNGIFVYPQLEEKVLELIREFKLEDRTAFSSFNHYSMVKCKKLAPHIPTGLLTSSWIVDAGAYGQKLGADYINAQYCSFTPENIQEIEDHGLGCNAWTVNREEDLRRLIAAGITSVITNFPDLAGKILKEQQ